MVALVPWTQDRNPEGSTPFGAPPQALNAFPLLGLERESIRSELTVAHGSRPISQNALQLSSSPAPRASLLLAQSSATA